MAIVLRAHMESVDLPENAANVLITLIGAVNAAYFLSSSWEACHQKGDHNGESGNNNEDGGD
jgi:hypothetical protein